MSALRMPSDEVTSILGAPARIATPTPELATLTRLSATSLPCLMRSSICAAGSMTTSATSPSATRLWTAVTPPQVVVTLWPVAFSKPGTSNVYGSLVPGEPMTLISAALATPLSIAVAVISVDWPRVTAASALRRTVWEALDQFDVVWDPRACPLRAAPEQKRCSNRLRLSKHQLNGK